MSRVTRQNPTPSSPVQAPAQATRNKARRAQGGSASAPTTPGRPNTRNARGGSNSDVTSNGGVAATKVKGRLTKAASKGKTEKALAPVTEIGPEEESDESGGQQYYAAPTEQSPGGRSALSGNTAVTSLSVGEIHDLTGRVQQIFDRLPGLHDNSSSILSLLGPVSPSRETIEKLSRDLRTPDSSKHMRFRKLEKDFRDDFDVFAGSSKYIQPDYVLRAIFNVSAVEDIGQGSFRPDAILFKANLANLLTRMIPGQPEFQNTYFDLQYLSRNISKLFLSKLSSDMDEPGASVIASESFNLVLAICTQLAVIICGEEQAGDGSIAREVLVTAFESAASNEALFEADGVDVPSFATLCEDRIREMLRTNNETDQSLTDAYPWEDFQLQVVSWVHTRQQELDTAIAKVGDQFDITENLKEQASLQHFNAKSAGPNAHRELAERAKRLSGNTTLATENMLGSLHKPTKKMTSAEATMPASEAPQAAHAQQTSTKSPRNLRAKQSLLDRQDTSTKVTEVSLEDDTQPSQSPMVVVTQDGGFVSNVQTRAQPKAAEEPTNKRKSGRATTKSKGQHQPPSKKQKTKPSAEEREETADAPYVDDANNEAEAEDDDVEEESSSQRSSAPLLSANNPPPSCNYTQVKEEVKMQRESNPPLLKVQQRSPWEEQEVDALVYYIEHFGTSWVAIWNNDMKGPKYLQNRGEDAAHGQVALKDKARNMKFDWLLSGVPLPPNFERVMLSRPQIHKLSARGIEVVQDRVRARPQAA